MIVTDQYQLIHFGRNLENRWRNLTLIQFGNYNIDEIVVIELINSVYFMRMSLSENIDNRNTPHIIYRK